MPIRVEIQGPEFHDRFLVESRPGVIDETYLPRAIRTQVRACGFTIIEIDVPEPEPQGVAP